MLSGFYSKVGCKACMDGHSWRWRHTQPSLCPLVPPRCSTARTPRLQGALHPTHCTPRTAFHALHSTHCTPHAALHALHPTRCTPCTAHSSQVPGVRADPWGALRAWHLCGHLCHIPLPAPSWHLLCPDQELCGILLPAAVVFLIPI